MKMWAGCPPRPPSCPQKFQRRRKLAALDWLAARLAKLSIRDRDLLMQTAIAARGAGHPEEALALYQKATTIGEPRETTSPCFATRTETIPSIGE